MPFEGPPGQPPSGEGTLELPSEEIAKSTSASLELQRRPNLELQRSPKLELSRLELKPEFRPGMVPPDPDREPLTRSPFKSSEGPAPQRTPMKLSRPPEGPPVAGDEVARASGDEALEMSGWGGETPPPASPRPAPRVEQETVPVVDITFTPTPSRRRGRSTISPAQKGLLGSFLVLVLVVLMWPRSSPISRGGTAEPTPPDSPGANSATPVTMTLTQLTNPEFVGPRQATRPVEETPTPAPVAEPPLAPPAPPVAPAIPPEAVTPAETPAAPAPEPVTLAVTVLTTPKDVQATVILAKDDLRYEESGSGSIKLSPDKPGSYKLKVSAPGYRTYQGTVKVAKSHRLAVALEPAPAPAPAAPAYEPPPSYYQPPAYSGGGGGRSGGGGGGRYELPAPGL